MELLGGGDSLKPHGVPGVAGLNQGQVIGGDGHTQGAQAGLDALFLFGGQLDVFFQVLQGLDAVFNLPSPVVPLLIGDVGEQFSTARYIHCGFTS